MFTVPSRQTAQVTAVPAPVGGLNAYDSLAAMPATDAIALNNLVPQPFGCTVRKGYQVFKTGMPAAVNTIAGWTSTAGADKFFAWSGTGMYDVTTPGVVGAAMVSALTSSWWQTVNFANSAGTWLVAFNGQDDPILYGNSGVARLVAGDGIVANTIAGVDPADLIQATVHQRRIWAVQVNSTVGWYWPTDSIYGTLASYDFGPLFKLGGYLTMLATWTVDSGGGSDDHLVAISSNGEAAVFAGVDVSDPNSWALRGVYFIGPPIRGRRFATNVAGDLFLLTLTGVVSLATVLTSTQVNISSNNTYSRKIQYLLSELTNSLRDLEGWQLQFIPAHNFLFINVPTVFFGGAGQLVSNHINTSWCTFSGYDAACWAVLDGQPYFGDPDGRVLRAFVGDLDDVATDGSGGTNILSYAEQAYSYLNASAMQKQVGMYRPNFLNVQRIAYASRINYDFDSIQPPAPGAYVGAAIGTTWGTGIWGVDTWSGGVFSQRDWSQVTGIGVAVSLAIRLTTSAETVWISTDYSYKVGSIL